jgi:hypothetical protein
MKRNWTGIDGSRNNLHVISILFCYFLPLFLIFYWLLLYT